MTYSYLVGGFNPSEKYESQLGWLFPIYGKNKIHGNQTTNQLLKAIIYSQKKHPIYRLRQTSIRHE